jgi:hypothetical protein
MMIDSRGFKASCRDKRKVDVGEVVEVGERGSWWKFL